MSKYNIALSSDSIIIEKDAVISFRDFESIKEQATEYVNRFKDFELTEENFSEAKKIRADLNGQSKIINDARIRIKKEVMVPYDNLANQVKELDAIIDSVNTTIDTQIKRYTALLQKEKADKAEQYLQFRISQNKELTFVKLSFLQDLEWDKASTSITAIQADIDNKLSKISDDLEKIKGLDNADRTRVIYESNGLNLGLAIETIMSAIKREKELSMNKAAPTKKSPPISINESVDKIINYPNKSDELEIEEIFTELNLHIKNKKDLARIKALINLMPEVSIIEEIEHGQYEK